MQTKPGGSIPPPTRLAPHLAAAVGQVRSAAVQPKIVSPAPWSSLQARAPLGQGGVVQRMHTTTGGGIGNNSDSDSGDEKDEKEQIWEKIQRLKLEEQQKQKLIKKGRLIETEEEEIPEIFVLQQKLLELKEDHEKGNLSSPVKIQLVGLIKELNKVEESNGKGISSKLSEIIKFILGVAEKQRNSFRALCKLGFISVLKKFNTFDCHNKFCVKVMEILGEKLNQ